MGTQALDRTAPTDRPILDVIAGRWSPRAFDATTPIDEAKLANALEAARWAPSAYNVQPWRFLVTRRGTAEHAAVVETLIGFNQAWAGHAAALLVAVADTAAEDGAPYTHAFYDLGQAVANLAVQAHHDGLVVHQMSGFDPEAVRARFELPERLVPTTVIALGDLGDVDALPEQIRERELAPRVRRAVSENVLVDA